MQFLANCTELPQRRLCEGLVLVLVYIFNNSICTEEMVPVRVDRRLNGDICYFDQGDTNFETCNLDVNLTYLIDERQCASNQEFFNGIIVYCQVSTTTIIIINMPNNSYTGCDFAIAINESLMGHKIAAYINVSNHILMTFNEGSQPTTAILTYQGQYLANKLISDCRIVNLEVYRGRQRTFVINHNGFTINNGTIEVR